MAVDVIREKRHLFLGSRLKRLAEQMQADAAMVAQRAGLGVQPGQYPLLAELEEAGPRTVGELTQAMGISQPAITKTIDRLIVAGLVDANRSDTDRRVKIVALSDAGRTVLERSRREVWPFVEAAVKEVTDDLSGPLLEQVAEIEARLAARPLSNRAMAAARRIPIPPLTPAADADVPAIVALMNLAYRGTGPEAGWTTEADYIEGDRMNEAMLRDDLAVHPAATMLLWRREPDGSLLGCVWLEPEEDGVWYLGSLTVDPREQNRGLGRRLLEAAENWVGERGGREVKMTVVNVRDTLLAWYGRRGYLPAGETRPFPWDDNRFGIPRRDDLHFVVLHKRLQSGGADG